MFRIIRIGADVHTTNFTLCAIEPVLGGEDRIIASVEVAPDYKNIIMFIENLKMKLGYDNEYDILCGYEAGCFGYSLYKKLVSAGIRCEILAPSTMLTQQGQRVKTDTRDARTIATCLAYGCYHSVYVPSEKDEEIKDYLRMRDDHKHALTKIKQQINAFCLRHDYHYVGTKWTGKHFAWMHTMNLSPLAREVLEEYLNSYFELSQKIERMDERIEEFAELPEYVDKVKRLLCFVGVKTYIALSLIVETSDFSRFRKGNIYAAYLGLAPGENSSGAKIHRTGITKAGNSHLRKLLIEAGQGICQGRIGYKSKELKARQRGALPEVIAYADKGNVRLRSKYYKMMRRGKKKNVAVAAIARELACFIWGMMTDNIALQSI